MIDKYAQMTFPIFSFSDRSQKWIKSDGNGKTSEIINVCILWRQRLIRVALGVGNFCVLSLQRHSMADTRTLLISHNESNLISRRERLPRRQHQLLFVFVSPFKHNYFSICFQPESFALYSIRLKINKHSKEASSLNYDTRGFLEDLISPPVALSLPAPIGFFFYAICHYTSPSAITITIIEKHEA